MKHAAWFIAGALLLVRIAFLGATDVYPEEAYYWNYAAHLDIGYLDHPPLVAWLIHLGTLLAGDTALGVRIFSVVCILITSAFVVALTRLLFRDADAGKAVLFVHLLPFYFVTGFIMTPDAPLTVCWAGALYFLARALLREETWSWLGLGVCLGLGMLSKYSIGLVGLATLVFITADPAARRWWRHPAPYAAVALALLIFSPVILWNWQHDWASFAFQSTGRVAEKTRFSTHELLAAMLVVLTPVGLVLAWRALAAPAIELDERRRRLFLRVFTLVPLAVFLVFSVTHRVKLNWTGPLWLVLLPAMAAQLSAPPRWLRRAWTISAVALAGLALAFLQYLSFGLPGLGYRPETELLPVGWSELGRELDRQRAAVAPAGGERVVLVGMDRNFIASAAAFYHSRPRAAARETTGVHLFGSASLMYAFWNPPADFAGATLLLVSFHRGDLDRTRVRRRVGRLGPIEEHWIERAGQRVRPYYTRVAADYRP